MSRRGGGDWERGADYLIGAWDLDASVDLDEFAVRLEAIRHGRTSIIAFRSSTISTSTAPSGGAVVLDYCRERQRIKSKPQNAEERLKRAYRKQRKDFEDRIRISKIARIQAQIAGLDAMPLSVKQDVDLDVLKRDFEARLEEKMRSKEDLFEEDPEMLSLYLSDPTSVEILMDEVYEPDDDPYTAYPDFDDPAPEPKPDPEE